MTENFCLRIVKKGLEQTTDRLHQLVFYVEQSIYDQIVFLSKSRIFCSETLFCIKILLVFYIHERDSCTARNRKSRSFEYLVRNMEMWLTLVLISGF
ncbi:hypothetical protein NY2A_b254L [Paramecium bursaria Chlorella virus NY2A]|uniref:Uncharacterized protein b254L n=1 Tax=Paramecium bursaria Chlorella virus NY2A TaxID=46021 RepID=A7IWC9_PBCVN|nr:hypothetical protein NY2A_b254L [Paramecium bursaria Chlorella virus NY2A]YP_001498316.1 hypothetical protein AR158_c235L [Paramecium bursaria Chlorella virus AR158]ABT14653.1 hypothetical protein NY2A_b254L [Paramecium bursaria Chlorella virus NY2A]ABU43780.1 hypothetical protein AR158_c235L [Paramecium bursaria Chlorella virus AR158]